MNTSAGVCRYHIVSRRNDKAELERARIEESLQFFCTFPAHLIASTFGPRLATLKAVSA